MVQGLPGRIDVRMTGGVFPEFFPNPLGQKYDTTKARPMLEGNQQGAPEGN